ncbi:unnamed protein product, partial [Ixodes persulcatus]
MEGMEPTPTASLWDGVGAALLEETSCLLKATNEIWFRCCSCTHATRDQHEIVSHLVAHGDEQF